MSYSSVWVCIADQKFLVMANSTELVMTTAQKMGLAVDAVYSAALPPRNGYIKTWGLGELRDYLAETRQYAYRCRRCGGQRNGIVCGGDYPFARRNWPNQPYPNAYFVVTLPDLIPTGEVIGEATLITLDDEDWREMLEHAAAGCISEVTCWECQTLLLKEKVNG
ncbi:MAG: hypothetical protein FOGNACKC_00813 [Anaerolineae bacterium]|nr:hypothetical protein [Anaerolineae bacterium]